MARRVFYIKSAHHPRDRHRQRIDTVVGIMRVLSAVAANNNSATIPYV